MNNECTTEKRLAANYILIKGSWIKSSLSFKVYLKVLFDNPGVLKEHRLNGLKSSA